jgi:hypothetical protein
VMGGIWGAFDDEGFGVRYGWHCMIMADARRTWHRLARLDD